MSGNHRQFFDWIAKQRNIKSQDDWYRITKEDVYKRGGKNLLDVYYGKSLGNALRSVYPEVEWQLWRLL